MKKKLEFENKRQEELFNNNIGFAYKQAREWSDRCCIDQEELESYALESLCIAAIRYDYDKCNRFLNYAAIVINTNIRRQLKSRHTQKRLAEKGIIGFEDESNNFEDPENNIEYNTLLLAVEQILSDFPAVQREAIEKYLINRMTLNELAEEYNVSMRTIHKWVLKGKEVLREKLTYLD